jgi:Leucine-rich repeat (LRR) protein
MCQYALPNVIFVDLSLYSFIIMKTAFFQVLFLIPALVFGQYTAIPDINFEKALIEFGMDDLIDGKVLSKNIKSVKSLDISWKEIADLTGIKDFDSLQFLNCAANPFTFLDVSNNTALKGLDLDAEGDYSCRLTGLDLSNNTKLTFLDSGTSKLQKLDLSKNIELKELYCSFSNIKKLDLSTNNKLITLDAGYNKLRNLDLSNNRDLQIVDVRNNKLKKLVLTNNSSIKSIRCSGNKFDCRLLHSKRIENKNLQEK